MIGERAHGVSAIEQYHPHVVVAVDQLENETGVAWCERDKRLQHRERCAILLQRGADVTRLPKQHAELLCHAGEGPSGVDIRGIGAMERLQNRECLPVAPNRAPCVPEVRDSRSTLYVAHALVCTRELATQRRVGRRFTRELVEIGETVTDEPRTNGRGAGKVLDRVVIVEQHGIRQPAHVVEAALGPRLCGDGKTCLTPRGGRLPSGRRHAGGERDEEQHDGGDGESVPPNELRGAVPGRVGMGMHGPAGEQTANVVLELLHRGVATLGLLTQRRQHDGVEVAA